MTLTDLRHILMEVLPSCAVVEQGQILRIQSHLERIRGHLWDLNAVITDAELRAINEESLGDWVANVSETMVDLEDLLDSIIDQKERAVTTTTGYLSHIFLSGTREAFRLKIVCKLKKLRLRLHELVQKGIVLHLREETSDSMDPCKDEYSTILGDVVVGRDKDMEKVVEILQQQQWRRRGRKSSSHIAPFLQQQQEKEAADETMELQMPFLVAIYDDIEQETLFSGSANTTLAQMIYHHPWVKQYFRHRIWVDMSNFFSFDIIGIAREFAKAITNEETCSHLQSLTNMQEFWVFLDQQLSGNNYLLVLNNLPSTWEDKDEWNQLKHILLGVGGPGSTLVVTTTRYSYVLLRDISLREYYLECLSQNAWVELFMKNASTNRPNNQDQLEKISFAQKIYNSSNKSTIDAKLLGSTLRYAEFSRWQTIVDYVHSVGEELNENEKLLCALNVLHQLPTRIGRSLLYAQLCGESLHKEDFMNIMFVEGLTPNSNDKRARLNYLEKNMKIYGFFAENLTNTQYYSRMNIDQDATRISKQCRHLCLSFQYSNALSFPKALFEDNKTLRTLIFLPQEEDTASKIQKSQATKIPLQDMFANLVHLRILHLQDTRIKHLPRTISKLRHLKYLNLSHTKIRTLPRSICNLWNLQVLKLARCEKLEKLPIRIHKLCKLKVLDLAYCEKLQMLPTTITGLVNLQELYLQGCIWLVQLPEGFSNLRRLAELNMQKCVSLIQMPRGIGQMTELIRLSGYTTYDDYAGISALAELKTLVHLKELRLQGLERVSSSELTVVQGIKLHEKSMLQTLSLMWQWSDYVEEKDVAPEAFSQQRQLQLQLIEDLRPTPRSLEMLEIISYLDSKLPSWMTNETKPYLEYLKEVRLVNLKRCERLPPLGHLPYLKVIEISGMELIRRVDDVFYGEGGEFRRLEQLTFSQMPELEEWIAPIRFYRGYHLDSLEHVTLIQCPKFKFWELSKYISYLQLLEIWLDCEMFLTSKFQEWRYMTYIRTLKIVGCQELRFLPVHIRYIYGLEELWIIWCHELLTLPDWLEKVRYLKQVMLCGCTKLLSIPQGLLNKSSIEITIENCPPKLPPQSAIYPYHEIGQMTDLIGLSGYGAYDDYIGIIALAELKTLVHLKELCLQGLERISSSESTVVQDIKLYEKSMLQTLSLMWQWSDYMEAKDVDLEAFSQQQQVQLQLIEDLRPNPRSLEILEIISYMGSKLPSWMTIAAQPYLKHLKEVRLVNLKRCERLPPLGHLPYLKVIEISGMELIRRVDDVFYGEDGIFHHLKQLTFSQMPELEEWIAPPMRFDREYYLYSLKHVTLIQCPKFKFWELLVNCTYYFSLEIWLNCGMLLTPKFPRNLDFCQYIGTLKIVGCQELRILPEHVRDFHGLQELWIIWCQELMTLPDWLGELEDLKKVMLCGCTKLSSIPRGLLYKSSVVTTIQNCPKLQAQLAKQVHRS